MINEYKSSINVYEAGDGVTWVRITTLSLALTTPFNLGMSALAQENVQVAMREIAVQTEMPEAIFTASVTSGEAPLTVEFDASASTGSGELSYEWRFGDGGTTEGVRVTHTFSLLGEFGVILTVRNGDAEDTETQVVTVEGDGPPVVVQVPFTVNEELDVGTKAVSIYGPAYLESTDTVPAPYLVEGDVEFIDLTDDEGSKTIALDFLYGGYKDTLTFDAEHTAKAIILYSQGAIGMPSEDFPDFLSAFPITRVSPRWSRPSA